MTTAWPKPELSDSLQDRERRLIEYRLGAPYTEDMVVTLSFVGEQQQRMSVNDIRGLDVDKLAQLHKVSMKSGKIKEQGEFHEKGFLVRKPSELKLISPQVAAFGTWHVQLGYMHVGLFEALTGPYR